MKKKQAELDKLLGVIDKKSKTVASSTDDDFLRELKAKAKRKEIDQRRKERAKNIATMAKAKKQQEKKERENT